MNQLTTVDILALASQKEQMAALTKTNGYTEQFGLILSEEDAAELLAERSNALKEQRRVEFGEGILPRIIYEFCDSDFMEQDTYVETLARLQEIFYLFKGEAMDELTDGELLAFMRQQFDEICFGDLDYLESTCLKKFADAVRAGYRGYQATGGREDFDRFDIRTRWDRDLYLEALAQQF